MATVLILSFIALSVAAALAFLWARRRRVAALHETIFNRLALPDVSDDVFDARAVVLLPPPATRYLRHAIDDGAPLAKTVDLHLIGEIRARPDGDWFKFEARERICPERGFLWQARIEGLGRISADGAEYCWDGRAGSDFFLAGILPLVRVRDGEFGRSAAGRLVIDSIWLPSSLVPMRGATWQDGDEHRATVGLPERPELSRLNLTVAESGSLVEVSMMRHQGGEGQNFGLMPFGIRVHEERRFGPYTIPSEAVAVWGYGTDDSEDFMRLQVEDARFL